jgi:hypothetical protein
MIGQPTQIHFREDMPNFAPLRRARLIASLVGSCLAAVLFLSSCATTTQSATSKPNPNPAPDFTHYDVPLYQQVTKRIQTKILARLGEGHNSRDRYFMIPFAFENDGNDPEYSHSFITVIRVLADDKQPKLTPGITKRTYKDRNFEAFTISWLPDDFLTTHKICVFKGFGARLIPSLNKCPLSEGRAYNLAETVSMAVYARNALCMWGPYEIEKGGFDLGVRRLRLLESGAIKYRADDRGLRKKEKAINCFHAMAGLDVQYPDGGVLGTGFKTWGINGTARVLHEYTDREKYKQLLMEPVNEKEDRYGFVYAPTRGASNVYDPFKVSSAYHR